MREYKSERGATLIMVALSLSVLLGFVALSTDVGVGYAERRKMQNAADAGALAGTLAFGNWKTDAEILAAVNEYTVVRNRADSYKAYWMVNNVANCQIGVCTRPVSLTGIQVKAYGSASTFFARLLGTSVLSTGATAAAEFSPVDVVLLVGRPNPTDDDTCSLRSAFQPGQACASPALGGEKFPGIVSKNSCPACKGVWSTTDAKCHVGTATGPLMSPAPAGCPAGVSNATTCAACKGVWATTAVQPLANDKDAAIRFIALNTYPVTQLALVQYYGTCADKANPALTSNFASVATAINKMGAGGQASNIACAVNTAVNELRSGTNARPGASKFILLFSDGVTNRPFGDTNDLICKQCTYPNCCPQAVAELNAAAQNASNLGVHISVVGLGSVADTAFLQKIADGINPDGTSPNPNTKGLMFYRAPGTSPALQADLEAIYKQMVKDYKYGLTQ
jgi:hypothetical protein